MNVPTQTQNRPLKWTVSFKDSIKGQEKWKGTKEVPMQGCKEGNKKGTAIQAVSCYQRGGPKRTEGLAISFM